MATTTQLEARLAEAESALHELMLGKTVVKLKDAGGDEVEYSRADQAKLEGYIAVLKQRLGKPGGYRAIGVVF